MKSTSIHLFSARKCVYCCHSRSRLNLMITETTEYKVSLLPEGIIHVHYKEGTKVTVNTLKELEELYFQLTDIPRPYIFTAEEFISFSNETLKYAQEMDLRIPISGSVVVAVNLAQKILAQYYFKLKRPHKPVHVASTFEEGIAYLSSKYPLVPIS